MLENKSAINRATRVPVSAARKTMLDAERLWRCRYAPDQLMMRTRDELEKSGTGVPPVKPRARCACHLKLHHHRRLEVTCLTQYRSL
jgi:hypothetical protein